VQPSVCTFPELLQDTGGGVLSGANTPEALAGALEPLLLDPERLVRLGEAGRRAVLDRYTDDHMARRMVETLQ